MSTSIRHDSAVVPHHRRIDSRFLRSLNRLRNELSADLTQLGLHRSRILRPDPKHELASSGEIFQRRIFELIEHLRPDQLHGLWQLRRCEQIVDRLHYAVVEFLFWISQLPISLLEERIV